MVGGHDEREQTLNQLLVEMDGFDSSKGVIIMAATNRPEVLDAALLRPGRFDRQVVVDKPDVRGREAILRVHARNVKLGPGVELKVIAARTPGFAGADLANIVNEAALLAARKGKDAVEMADFEEAIDRVDRRASSGRAGCCPRPSGTSSPTTRWATPWSPSSLPHADPVHKVTIIPRGVAALGMTYQLPTEDRYLLRRSRAGRPDRGAPRRTRRRGARLRRAVHRGSQRPRARDGVRAAHGDEVRDVRAARPADLRRRRRARLPRRGGLPWAGGGEREYSEDTARAIDEEVRRIVEGAYERVRALLAAKKDILLNAAAVLKEQETLQGDPLQRLLAGELVRAGV